MQVLLPANHAQLGCSTQIFDAPDHRETPWITTLFYQIANDSSSGDLQKVTQTVSAFLRATESTNTLLVSSSDVTLEANSSICSRKLRVVSWYDSSVGSCMPIIYCWVYFGRELTLCRDCPRRARVGSFVYKDIRSLLWASLYLDYSRIPRAIV